ncbi:efflux RND transporter periplasmic adaptor subunit [Hydrocarboniphaga effusa]|uniref:efflux RND transporter periplasmic adaptor subunit n=1 Tax=Hydrocarboniphaga effusa TaxID=243629 RepID=UPI00398BD868
MKFIVLILLGALLPGAAAAAEAAPSAVSLSLSKPLQRSLAITTLTIAADAKPTPQQAWGEIVSQPAGPGFVQAAQAGRLVAPATGWPLPGDALRAGQTLALLEPVLDLAERSRREAQLAELTQRQFIAKINVDRLALQSQARMAADDKANLYFEEARAEARSLEEQIGFLRQSLQSRIEIRAAEAGVVQRSLVSAGSVVEGGQRLFELRVQAAPRLAWRRYQAPNGELQAQALMRQGDAIALKPAGYGVAADGLGWTLWMDFASAPKTPLAIGELVRLRYSEPAGSTRASVVLPRRCVQGSGNNTFVWLHVGAERFERRAVQLRSQDAGSLNEDSVAIDSGLAPQDRVVDRGASLLTQYRIHTGTPS